jgi:hypothetical protein
MNLIHLSQTLHVLPYPGGILDQDALFVLLYNHVEECQAARAKIDERQEQMKNNINNSTRRRR